MNFIVFQDGGLIKNVEFTKKKDKAQQDIVFHLFLVLHDGQAIQIMGNVSLNLHGFKSNVGSVSSDHLLV